MAIVGTAYVRLRVLGDKLKKDISDSVKSSIDASSTDLKASGEEVGEKITQGVEDKVTKEAAKTGRHVADDLGNAIGNEMGKRFNSSIGVKLLSAFDGMWTNLKRGVSTGVRDVGKVFNGIKGVFVREEGDTRSFAGRLLGAFGSMWRGLTSAAKSGASALGRAFKGIGSGLSSAFDGVKGFFEKAKSDVEKGGTGLLGRFGTLKNSLSKALKGLKLGDFLAPLIGLLVTALPSALSFAGALLGSFVGFAITSLAALGPAIAGGALAGVAAFGTLKLSMGLFSLAMKAQTPQLADYKKRLEGFKETIGKPIQEGMLSGFNAAMRISGPLIKSLNPELRGFGFNVGDIAINISKMLSSAQNMDRLQRIFTVNNDAVKLFGGGIQGLVQAFLILFDHLSPIILYLADGAKQLGQWASTAIQAAEASGKLDTFVSKMFNSLTYFVGILVDFGKGIANVFRAAFASSGGMLTNLQGIAQKFAEWTGSDAGQAKMIDFFTKARIVTDKVLEIIGKISKAAGGGLGGMNVDSLVHGLSTLESLGKPIAEMFKQIKEASGGAWSKAFTDFAKVITQLAKDGALGILAKSLSDVLQVLSAILSLPGMDKLVSLAAAFLVFSKTAKLLMVALKLILAPLKFLVGLILDLAAAIGWPLTLVILLTAALVWFFTQTKIGRKIVEEAWNAIKAAGEAVWHALVKAWNGITDGLKAAFNWIKDHWPLILEILAGPIGWAIALFTNFGPQIFHILKSLVSTVGSTLSSWAGDVIDFFKGLPGKAWDAIKEFGPKVAEAIGHGLLVALEAVGKFILDVLVFFITLPFKIVATLVVLGIKLWEAIKAGFEFLWSNIPGWWDKVVAFFAALPGRFWDGLKNIGETIWNGLKAAWDWVSSNTSAAWDAIVDYFTHLPGRFWDGLKNIGETIWNGLKAAWDWISTNTSAAWDAVVDYFKNLPHRFVQGLQNIGSDLWNLLTSAFDHAKTAVSDGIEAVVNFVKGLPGKIRDVGGDMLDAGKHLIESMLSGLGKAASFVGNIGKTVANAIIRFINNDFIDHLNADLDFTILGVHINAPDIPHIPLLAKGGVVSPRGGGTLAMVGEAGSYERVEPLDENGLSKRDHAILRLIGDGAGGDTSVRVFIGDTELTSIVRTEVDKKNKNLASSLATGRKG